MSECLTLSSRDSVLRRSYSCSGQISIAFAVCNEDYYTIKITRPRSPATFKCLLAISSRYGMITVHPCLAVDWYQSWCVCHSVNGVCSHTQPVDNVSAKESCSSKYSRGVAYALLLEHADAPPDCIGSVPPREDLHTHVSIDLGQAEPEPRATISIYLPPWTLRMGFPVLVMAMSATFRDPIGVTFLVDRAAARRPAILDGLQDFCIIVTTRSRALADVVGVGNGKGKLDGSGLCYGHSNRFVPSASVHRASRSWWEQQEYVLRTPYSVAHQAKLQGRRYVL